MRIRFIVTVEVEAMSEAEAWRRFNAQLSDGDGRIETQVIEGPEITRVAPRNTTMIPTVEHDTFPACRDGDTLPCSGVQPTKKF